MKCDNDGVHTKRFGRGRGRWKTKVGEENKGTRCGPFVTGLP
jgi:hypothetical protein